LKFFPFKLVKIFKKIEDSECLIRLFYMDWEKVLTPKKINTIKKRKKKMKKTFTKLVKSSCLEGQYVKYLGKNHTPLLPSQCP